MDIVDVERFLARDRDGADSLRMTRLTALEPRAEPYSAILCQPRGRIHASPARIGNSDSSGVMPMYRAFLSDAVTAQAQLAITPEYSVPWALISEIIRGAPRPPKGSLWALGCESITPGELDALRLAANGNEAIRILHEDVEPQQRAQAVFLDPLVFVFWAVNNSGDDVLCFLVQFKTVASRDIDHVELQSLCRGSSVYKFTAQAGDVSLIALICSDAFEFTNELVDAHCTNLLLIHVQLNPRPAHVDYSAYRSRLFSVASNNNVEVVCLNWAAAILTEGNPDPWNSTPGSAWYIAPPGVEPTDDTVNQLHREGVYYSVVGVRWHAFYLNCAPHWLLVRKQPVFIAGPQVLARRIPPQVIARRGWDGQQETWTAVTADDGFRAFVQQYEPLNATLPQLCERDPLAVERALELLEGPDGQVSRWYTLEQLTALKVADEESLRRVTVSQETSTARAGVAFRRRRARHAQTAATIPGQPLTWPMPVSDLAAGFCYRWTNDEPHSNVEPVNGGRPAAFVYLGENPETDTLANVYAKLAKARTIHAYTAAVEAGVDPRDAVSRAHDRLCVVYKDNHTLRVYRPTGYASISDPAGLLLDDVAAGE
ncbi:MAG: hypothetical protein F4Y41_08595 [Gammaproteobacteria bacterium]|nr:hypothetical protein [Gammaproteobacteria bacterium]